MNSGIAKIVLKSKINRYNHNRQKKFLSWVQVNKIALLIEPQPGLNKNFVDAFIEETKKYIEVFYIETDSKNQTYSDWHCFSKQDKSILGLPKKKTEAEFKNKEFDVVINTCHEDNLFALAICSYLPAHLKCGRKEGFGLSDLMIQETETFQLKNYLHETLKYLKMIRV